MRSLCFLYTSLSVLLLCGNTWAQVNCGEIPSCAALGFNTIDDDNCASDGYLYCPFDSSYKKCVKHNQIDCSAYALSKCPDGAKCSACGIGTTITYKVDSCEEGYTLADGTCTPSDCSDYTLSSCPDNVTCSECKSGTTVTYKATFCADDYYTDARFCGRTGTNGWMLTYSLVIDRPSAGTLSVNSLSASVGGLPAIDINTDWVSKCGKCTPRQCMPSYTEENCLSEGVKEICYSGDTLLCRMKSAASTHCNGCSTGYDCSNVGGDKCSTTSTYQDKLCLRCASGPELAQ